MMFPLHLTDEDARAMYEQLEGTSGKTEVTFRVDATRAKRDLKMQFSIDE